VDEIEVQKAMNKNQAANSMDVELTPLKATTSIESNEIARGNVAQILAMLTIRAPSNTSSLESSSRVPLDIVAVVDRSGSMGGQKIELVKETLAYVISQLTSVDRLSIVSFDDGVYPISGFSKVTDKDAMTRLVKEHPLLNAAGGTNIGRGLGLGLQMLAARKTKNPVTSVLLLTDGQDGGALSQVSQLVKTSLPPGSSIHCFGFGSDHDAKVLSSIAETARGTFTYIEAISTVGEAFAGCLGGLLSVVAQNIEIDIQIKAESHKIIKIHSTFSNSITGSGANIKVPDLFADEKRDLMLSFELPKVSEAKEIEFAVASVSYTDPKHKEKIRLDPVGFKVVRTEGVPEVVVVNPQLDVQRNRIAAADAIAEAVKQADSSNFEKAKKIQQDAIDAIQRSNTKDDALSKELVSDLQECIKRTSDRSQFSNGGMAWAKSAQIQHHQQRGCVQPSKVSNSYATPMQQMQQVQYQQQQPQMYPTMPQPMPPTQLQPPKPQQKKP